MHTLLGSISRLHLEIPNVWRVVMLFVVSACCTGASATLEPEFSLQAHSLPGMRNGSFGWADFDNDGDLDLFVCGDSSAFVPGSSLSHLYRNEGGTFVNTGIALRGYHSSSADWADFDNDGFVDLVLTGLARDEAQGTRVFRNLAGTNLVEAALLPGVYGGRAAWGDFNGDGFPDLAITGATFTGTGRLTRLFVNRAGTNFTQFQILPPETFYGTVDWADYDHDGKLDLLVTGVEYQGARVFRNEGDKLVSNEFSLIDIASEVTGQWIDANNDGWADALIVAHSMKGSFLMVNNGEGYFLNGSRFGMLGAYAVGDCNNDGTSDILLAGYRHSKENDTFIFDRTGLFLNSGTGEWPERTNLIVNLSAASAAWGDYDRDGRLDLIVHGQNATNWQHSYYTYLYRNVTARSNQPPRAPTGLNVTVEGEQVLLSWNAATDANQDGGLTYNVRVGSAPGQGDIVSPMSAPDGWRRVVKRGNADGRTFYVLGGLRLRQTYYWSVQAVDNSFSGSAFASEAAFTFTRPPHASNQVVVVHEDTSRTITLTGSDPDGDALNYLVLSGPMNGTLTGAAPNLTYRPRTNFHGQDAFSFQVSDGFVFSPVATVSITILPVNDPPVADASATRTFRVSGNGTNAAVTLDGSRSFDADGDRVGYLWRSAGSVMGTGEVALAQLPVGTNFIELIVDDGLASDTNAIAVQVVTPVGALHQLVLEVTAQVARPRPLISILSAAIASLNRSSTISAINQLKAFQNQAQTQVGPLNSALANRLIEDAQAVMDAMLGVSTSQTGRTVLGKLLARKDLSGTRMEFQAAAGRVHGIEASSNLRDWETIGVAVERTPGVFEFQDSNPRQFRSRFYRVVAP